MAKVSIIIPTRNEVFLVPTVKELLEKASGEIEVIVYLDGYWPNPPLPNDPRIIAIHRSMPKGMREGINTGVGVATGKYVMKIDGHCIIGEGYDEILQKDCDDDWMVIPRRYSLDEDNWCRREERMPVDYEYLRYPFYKPDEIGIHGTVWTERTRENTELLIDDNMAFQGSCWFMPKKYFLYLGGLSEEGYGTFIGEPQEIGNKVWLLGGRLITNKKTWYAHLHKGKKWGRGYFMNKNETNYGNLYSVDYWYNDRLPNKIHNFEWLIDKFWPVPSWPSKDRKDWKPWTLS